MEDNTNQTSKRSRTDWIEKVNNVIEIITKKMSNAPKDVSCLIYDSKFQELDFKNKNITNSR